MSGVTFPVTIPAGKTVNYTVTFTPPAAGISSGSISFASDASEKTLAQSLTGDGTSTSTQPTVTLSWDPSTSAVIGYNIYRATQSGGPYAKLNPAFLSSTTYTDLSVLAGSTYYYVSTAVDSGHVESGYSNQALAVVP